MDRLVVAALVGVLGTSGFPDRSLTSTAVVLEQSVTDGVNPTALRMLVLGHTLVVTTTQVETNDVRTRTIVDGLLTRETFFYWPDSSGERVQGIRTHTYVGGRETSYVDERGNTHAMAYDAQGRLTEVDVGAQVEVRYSLSPGGQLCAQTDQNGLTTAYTYDGQGRQVGQQYEQSGQQADHEAVTLDDKGNVSQRTFGSPTGQHVLSVTSDSLGRPVQVQSGLPTGDRGLHTLTQYDGLGRVTSRTDVDTGTVDTYQFGDALGRMTQHLRQIPSGGQTLQLDEEVSYASSGTGQYVTTTTTASDGLGGTRSKTVVTTLDQAGRTLSTQETIPTLNTDGSLGAPLTKLDRYAYDAQGRQVSHMDATGNTWLTTFDPMGRRVSAQDPSLATVTYAHDAAGNVTDSYGPLLGQGQHVHSTYDVFNQLSTRTETGAPGQPDATSQYVYPGNGTEVITDPMGTQTTRAYNGRYKVMSEQAVDDASGNSRTTTNQYDGEWVEQRQVTEGSWQATLARPSTPGDYGFDDQGRVLHETESWQGKHGTRYSYDTRTQWPESAPTRLSNVVTQAWTLGASNLTPGVISNQLDGLGNVISRQQGDTTDTWVYGAEGLLSQSQPGGTPPTVLAYTEGRLVRSTYGSGPTEVTQIGYEANGHEALRLDPTTSDGLTRYKATTYNERQLVAKEDYGANGDTTHSEYSYDADGNRQSAQEGHDPLVTTVYGYGNAHELTSVALPNNLGTFAYVYDRNRRLASIAAPSGVDGYAAPSQSFSYDYLDRLLSRRRGATASWVTSYADGEGTTTDADGNGQVTLADGRGRPTYQAFTPGGSTVSGLSAVTLGYDGKSQLAAQTETRNGGSTVTGYSFDARSRLTSEVRTGSNGAEGVTFGYVPGADRVQSATDSAGTATVYSYDALARVSNVSGTQVTWEAGGQRLTSLSTGGQEYETRCYNNRGLVTQLIHDAASVASCASGPNPATTLASFVYQYDDRDNRSVETYLDTSLTQPEVTTYLVDQADRLTGTVYPAGWGTFYQLAGDGTRTAERQVVQPLPQSVDYASAAGLGDSYDYRYSYDLGGALTGITQHPPPYPDGGQPPDSPVATYTADLEGRRHSEAHPALTYAQQQEGSALAGYGWSFQWDASNQMVMAQQTQPGGLTYQYENDGLGMRRAATQTDSLGNSITSHYVLAQGQLWAEGAGSGGVANQHYDRIGSLVTAIGGDAILHDSLNSAIGVLTSAGPRLYRYTAQGSFRVDGNHGEPVFGGATEAYAGGNISAGEPGVRLGVRTYDGFSGTWTSEDPVRGFDRLMTPMGLGTFLYAGQGRRDGLTRRVRTSMQRVRGGVFSRRPAKVCAEQPTRSSQLHGS